MSAEQCERIRNYAELKNLDCNLAKEQACNFISNVLAPWYAAPFDSAITREGGGVLLQWGGGPKTPDYYAELHFLTERIYFDLRVKTDFILRGQCEFKDIELRQKFVTELFITWASYVF